MTAKRIVVRVVARCPTGTRGRGIDSGNGPGGGKNGMPDDSGGELKEGELARYLRSTKTRLVEGYVPRQTSKGRMRQRCWRKTRCGWIRQ